MTDEITLSGATTQRKNWQMPRGDTRTLTFAHEWAASNINEARFWMKDADGNVVLSLSKESNPDQWDLTTDYEASVTPKAGDTEDLAVDIYSFGIEFRNADSPAVVYTVMVGTNDLYDDVVNDNTTTGAGGELSWQTREELTRQYTSLATCHAYSYLVADASSGASTITVADGSVFTDGDAVRIVLDSGTQDTTITVSDDTLTLGTNLSGDASKFNAVRVM